MGRHLKIILAFVFTSVIILLNVNFAFAEMYSDSAYIHGDFTANSNNCGSCHITHGSNSVNLLIGQSSNETEFCYFCHGVNAQVSSRYNVEQGVITGKDGSRQSYAGGFKQSLDPSRSSVSSDVYDNTSVHGVENAMRLEVTTRFDATQNQVIEEKKLTTSERKDGSIPGGSMQLSFKGDWTSSFTCGSCHDPHAGGPYPATPYKNPRLLRAKLLDNTARYVYMSIDYGNTYLPVSYGAGFNEWCGGCHDLFNTEGSERTGSTGLSNGGMNKFRHKVGAYVPDQVFSTDLFNGVPIPTDTKGDTVGTPQWRINCLSCHRAHGTAVNVSVGFRRFSTTTTEEVYYNDNEGQSALLRLPERSACYKCHGSAEYNLYNGNYQSGW